VYLFGGEFSSPKQGTFYHYNDVSYLLETLNTLGILAYKTVLAVRAIK